MPIEHIDAIFSRLNYVSIITFSGGEPALVPELLQRIRESARDHNLNIGNFYIATSTMVQPTLFKKFLIECLEWHLFCSDNEVSQVNWSNDEFHELNPTNLHLLKLLSFASPKYDTKFNGQHSPATFLIAEGRAKSIGGRPPRDDGFDFEDGNVREGTIYLNCLGELISGCDWSYESQSQHKICDVNSLTVRVLRKYEVKQ
jgi:hypothetical protein